MANRSETAHILTSLAPRVSSYLATRTVSLLWAMIVNPVLIPLLSIVKVYGGNDALGHCILYSCIDILISSMLLFSDVEILKYSGSCRSRGDLGLKAKPPQPTMQNDKNGSNIFRKNFIKAYTESILNCYLSVDLFPTLSRPRLTLAGITNNICANVCANSTHLLASS